MNEIEQSFSCPYCGEEITMVLDLSRDGQHTYIEDCEVCCRPIQVSFGIEESELKSFSGRVS